MSGIIPIDRRDLERMLKAAVHAEKRDEVEVKVIFCVQYSLLGEPDAVQTLVDPWQPFPRRNGVALSKAAIEALDERSGRNVVARVVASGNNEVPTSGNSQEPAQGVLEGPEQDFSDGASTVSEVSPASV